MSDPAIKGSAFESVVEDVRRLRDAGSVSDEQLEARLTRTDLALLGEKVLAISWYPIDSYRRLSELLLEVEGQGQPEYLEKRGARAAERLFPLYLQLRCGEQIGSGIRQMGGDWSETDGNLIASLAGAIFNFSRWRFVVCGSDTFQVEAHEALLLPDVARHAAAGFIQYTASRISQEPIRVTSRRDGDAVVFTLRRES